LASANAAGGPCARDAIRLSPESLPLFHALIVSTLLVALAEIGDKTQLLAIVLAARYRKPWPIIGGIFVATLVNHALAAGIGSIAGDFLSGPWMRWVLGGVFLAFAAWTLIPDKFDDDDAKVKPTASIFLATAVAFFLVEMGDKTQLATVALGARFHAVAEVAAGTTIGMMLANVPAVLVGRAAADKLPLKPIRIVAAAAFAIVGLYVLIFG
jgi:putative Ca2+/H+ antiporter (TMEM165/GDT1 family)